MPERGQQRQYRFSLRRRGCNLPGSNNGIEVEGRVVEALPNATFRVAFQNDHIAIAHICGKMRKNFIKVLLGDRVLVELSPYDLTRGRITYRYK